MKKVYKSKVDKWYIGICAVCTILLVGSSFLCYNTAWVLLIDVVFAGACLCCLFDILLHTDYTITGDKLYIRCGILFRMTLHINRIMEISHKSTILSSPALSARRICLRYGRKNCVYVSPKDQEDFISDIKSINPGIIVT